MGIAYAQVSLVPFSVLILGLRLRLICRCTHLLHLEEACAMINVNTSFPGSGGKPGSKTAKKGKKKLVLFSTGGARGAS